MYCVILKDFKEIIFDTMMCFWKVQNFLGPDKHLPFASMYVRMITVGYGDIEKHSEMLIK
jgi:hypothetical protein